MSPITGISAIAAALLLATASPARAADAVPPPLRAFADANDAVCRQLVPPLLARPDFAPVLKASPIDVAVVCRCARDKVEGDARLVATFSGEPAALDARLRQPEVTGYLGMRIVSATLACASQAMEGALQAAPLPR